MQLAIVVNVNVVAEYVRNTAAAAAVNRPPTGQAGGRGNAPRARGLIESLNADRISRLNRHRRRIPTGTAIGTVA